MSESSGDPIVCAAQGGRQGGGTQGHNRSSVQHSERGEGEKHKGTPYHRPLWLFPSGTDLRDEPELVHEVLPREGNSLFLTSSCKLSLLHASGEGGRTGVPILTCVMSLSWST